jgi:hypothetical protein
MSSCDAKGKMNICVMQRAGNVKKKRAKVYVKKNIDEPINESVKGHCHKLKWNL